MTHIDWSADSQTLQSNSGDYEQLFCTLIFECLAICFEPSVSARSEHLRAVFTNHLVVHDYACLLAIAHSSAVLYIAERSLVYLGTAATCKQVTSSITLRDTKWATSYCPLAYNTFGMLSVHLLCSISYASVLYSYSSLIRTFTCTVMYYSRTLFLQSSLQYYTHTV